MSYRDVNNVEYKSVTFKKAFMVKYWEKGVNKKGTIGFCALIRSFDKTEEAIRV